MTSTNPLGAAGVIVGVDTHRDEHVAVAIDRLGAGLGQYRLPATSNGYEGLHCWASELDAIVGFGIEGTGSYGAGLARYRLQVFVIAKMLRHADVHPPACHLSTKLHRPNEIEHGGGLLGGREVRLMSNEPKNISVTPETRLLATLYMSNAPTPPQILFCSFVWLHPYGHDKGSPNTFG